MRLEFQFRPASYVERDEAGLLRFPRVGAVPGVYELRIDAAEKQVYYGEAADLDRRWQRYRTPGAGGGSTNVRLGAHLLSVLGDGGRVAVGLADITDFDLGRNESVMDFRRTPARKLVENAAILQAVADGKREVLNLSLGEG